MELKKGDRVVVTTLNGLPLKGRVCNPQLCENTVCVHLDVLVDVHFLAHEDLVDLDKCGPQDEDSGSSATASGDPLEQLQLP